MSDKDGVPGTWSSARPLTISNSTGVCDINGNAATATRANSAAKADTATNANYANNAGYASEATKATFDKNGNILQSLPRNYNDVGSTILAASTVRFAGGSSGTYGEVVAGSNLNRPYNLDQDGGGFCGDAPSCPGTWVRVSSFSYDYNGKYIGLFRRIA